MRSRRVGTLPLLPLTSSHSEWGQVLLCVCSWCSQRVPGPRLLLPPAILPGVSQPQGRQWFTLCVCAFPLRSLLQHHQLWPVPLLSCTRCLTLLTAARVTRHSLSPSRCGPARLPLGMSRSSSAGSRSPLLSLSPGFNNHSLAQHRKRLQQPGASCLARAAMEGLSRHCWVREGALLPAAACPADSHRS